MLVHGMVRGREGARDPARFLAAHFGCLPEEFQAELYLAGSGRGASDGARGAGEAG